MKRSILISGILTSLILTFSCSQRKERASQTSLESDPSKRFLRFQLTAEPEYLDPGLAAGVPETRVVNDLFSGLVQHPVGNGKMVPELASRWTISKDKKTYTFHLRKEAVWSDERPVTAHDFVYAWQRVLNPATGSKYAYAMYPIKNGRAYNAGKITDPKELGFRAVDDFTFEVTLESPTPYFMDILWYNCFKPVPRWAIEKHGPLWTRPENIVTNGPFLLTSWIPHKQIVLAKNPDYFGAAKVKLAGIIHHPTEDKETAYKMYQSGELDILWEVPAMKAPTLKEDPEFFQIPWLGSYFYRLQTEKPPLNDVRVRQALAHATDREEIVNQYLQKTMIPTTSIVPAGLKGYLPMPGLSFDPERARKLLDEAGYTDRSKFPPLTVHYNTDDRHRLIAQVLQQMWKKHLGIEIKLWNEEWKSYMKTQNLKNFQISRSGWIADYPDPMTFLDLWTSDSTMSHTSWKNERYDRLISLASRQGEESKRLELLHEAEKILLEEASVIPIYTYTKMYMVRPYVKGYEPNLMDVHPFRWVYFEERSSSSQAMLKQP